MFKAISHIGQTSGKYLIEYKPLHIEVTTKEPVQFKLRMKRGDKVPLDSKPHIVQKPKTEGEVQKIEFN